MIPVFRIPLHFQLSLFLLFGQLQGLAQSAEQLPADTVQTTIRWHQTKAFRTLAVPSALMGYGVSVIGENGYLISSRSVRESLRSQFMGFRTRVDDFMAGAPSITVVGLSLAGISGRHGLRDQVLIGTLSYGLMISTVSSLKAITRTQRPDLTTYNSFPSAHTATAFMGAELLHQEYKHRSPWYSVGGYTVASATGVLRMLNDRHWLSDVFVGAGIGMLSTKVVYLLYPTIQQKVFSHVDRNLGFIPICSGGAVGFVAVYVIR